MHPAFFSYLTKRKSKEGLIFVWKDMRKKNEQEEKKGKKKMNLFECKIRKKTLFLFIGFTNEEIADFCLV